MVYLKNIVQKRVFSAKNNIHLKEKYFLRKIKLGIHY